MHGVQCESPDFSDPPPPSDRPGGDAILWSPVASRALATWDILELSGGSGLPGTSCGLLGSRGLLGPPGASWGLLDVS
eukprot:332297-Pyramimonas_sp.AAC.1